jgi:hypothetical protein
MRALWVVALSAVGCKGTPEPPPSPVHAPPPSPVHASSPSPVHASSPSPSSSPPVAAPSPSPSSWLDAMEVGEVPTGARVERAMGWKDGRGDNVATFLIWPDEFRIQVRHEVGGRLVREVRDALGECEFDAVTSYAADAFALTDLDGDGIRELTFAYYQTCTSDLSPYTLKVLVLEGGDKYILRGQSLIEDLSPDDAGADVGGEHAAEPPETRWPAGFYAHAIATWERVEVVRP